MPRTDFDVAGLAAYLHLSPQQIDRLVTRGRLPGRRVGGEWRFSHAEIHHWMEKRIGLADEEELVNVEGALSRHAENHGAENPTLASWLSTDTIAVPLAARTKNSVIESMTQLAARTGLLWDAGRMADAVRAREDLQSTAMECGMAFLHPRRPQASILAEPILALGRTTSGIPFGGDGGLTDIFVLICSTDDRGHLQILARLSRLAGNPAFLSDLRIATTAQDVYDLMAAAELELK